MLPVLKEVCARHTSPCRTATPRSGVSSQPPHASERPRHLPNVHRSGLATPRVYRRARTRAPTTLRLSSRRVASRGPATRGQFHSWGHALSTSLRAPLARACVSARSPYVARTIVLALFYNRATIRKKEDARQARLFLPLSAFDKRAKRTR